MTFRISELRKTVYFENSYLKRSAAYIMDQNKSLRKKEDTEELIIYDLDDTLYTTCPEIQIVLDTDRERKVTIVSGNQNSPSSRRRVQVRSQSEDLRRQAILNNALRTEYQSSRSRSRSRAQSPLIQELSESSSESRTNTSPRSLQSPKTASQSSQSISRSRSSTRSGPSRSRSVSRTRKPLYYRNRSRSGPRSRSRSRSLGRQVALRRARSRSRRVRDSDSSSRSIRLPSQTPIEELLRTPSEKEQMKLPESIHLPSPLFILTEQQVTGVSLTQSVEFVTKILLTTKKLTMKERQGLYAEMVKAESIGGSRSSTDLQDEDAAEDFNCKIYYSDKGIYIQTTQIVKKGSSSKHLKVTEEKTYPKICKTRIVGGMGKFIDGFLNVKYSETIEAKNQIYTRSEIFTVGLQTEKADGTYDLNSEKKTFDPTKTIKFSEKILFDRVNVGIVVNHSASADMSKYWDHEAGSFGEQNCEYREVNFFFGSPSIAPAQPNNKTPAKSDATRSSIKKILENSGQRALSSASNSNPNADQSQLNRNRVNTSVADQSYLLINPVATSTPRSEPTTSARSTETTPLSTPLTTRKRGAMSIRESARIRLSDAPTAASASGEKSRDSAAEVDIDKSLRESSSKSVSKKKKKQNADVTNNNSQYLYTTAHNSSYFPVKSANKSPNKSSVETKKSPISTQKTASSQRLALTPVKNVEITKSPTSPTAKSSKGQLRIKETKIIREVRETEGKPPVVNEKKEESVQVQDISFDRSKKPRSLSPYKVTTSGPSSSGTNQQVQTFDVSIDNQGKKVEANRNDRSIVVASKTPIKVDDDADEKLQLFREYLTLEALVDNKPIDINLNLDLLAKKQPKMEIKRVKFSGKLLWEKSSEWSLSSADQTSNTKTIACQQSDILGKKP